MKKYISFYPGPSKVYEKVPRYIIEAYQKGVLSINHRSPEFEAIYQNTVSLLMKKLLIPKEYAVFFTSSATECWEIIGQSLIAKKSHHIFNGAFGQKWQAYTKKLSKDAIEQESNLQEPIDVTLLNVSDDAEVICLTQNETSNGTQVSF